MDTQEPRLDMISPREAADFLDLPFRFMMKLVEANYIPHYKLPLGEIKFSRSELREFLRSCHQPAEGNPNA